MFEKHSTLAGSSRLESIGTLAGQATLVEAGVLVILGITAAMAGAVDIGLRIPGHTIAMVAMPMALGFAVVPRQLAGSAMSGSAMVTAGVLTASGFHHFGVGALAGLIALGPMLDLALARARSGWRLYLGFVLAGLAANAIAFATRGGSKLFQFEAVGLRAFDDWLSQAAVTYVLSGAFAGLLSASCWFRFRRECEEPRS